jgi:cystathionine beta-lyase/cystathionine gamma-synthase
VNRKGRPNLATLAVHAGEKEKISGAVATPIFQTATFEFKDTAEVLKFIKGDKDLFMYTRYGNPTIQRAEEKVAALEGGEAGLVFSSGMAAITTAVLMVVKSGDEIIATRNLYGGTVHFFNDLLPGLGIKVHYVDSENVAQAEKLVNKKTKILYIESPTNPNLKIVDIRKTAQIARKHKLISMIDSTFATPFNQRPLDLGIDLAIHSGTKYLGGHADIIAGVLVGRKSLVERARRTMKILGGSADPHAAFLLLRGVKTLGLRVEKFNRNALDIARFLSHHPKVRRVFYPGLTSHPQHKMAKSQMSGFGGIVCFELKGGLKSAVKVIDSFNLILNAASLGGVESLASLPVYTSHYGFSKEELKRADVNEGMVRVSCGIEDLPDLIQDLKQALAKA